MNSDLTDFCRSLSLIQEDIKALLPEINDKKIDPSPYQHRKYFDGNSLRELGATIEIIDVEMGKDPGYLTVGKTPLKRVHKLLSKLDYIGVNKSRAPWFLRKQMACSINMWNRWDLFSKNSRNP